MAAVMMRVWLALAIFAAAALAGSSARAHSAGQPSGDCSGCHQSGNYAIALTTNPGSFGPGANVTVTLTVTSPGGNELGTFVSANAGALATISGQGLAKVSAGLTHSAPKPMQSGTGQFLFTWTAPGQPGAVRFDVSTLVANGNNSSSGDLADGAVFDFVYGCEPFTYYRDFDGDGFGNDALPLIHCIGTTPPGYSDKGGDCNDNKETTYPGAVEVCNQIDDDCNGEVDDDAIPVALYPDADGDGYYGSDEYKSGDSMLGCVPTAGYAAESGDCEPDDPAVNPGAEEVCNLIDDNCDGKVDEKVRPRCGEGWCTREASTCDPKSCFPGEPRPEECNLFDDDCDGLVDNGAPCPAGQTCVAGTCSEAPAAAPPPSADGGCALGGARGSWLIALGSLLAALALRRRRAGANRALR
jgi:hypothetical protein